VGDVELVEAARRGDRHAFAAIYDAYAPRIHALCTRLLNEPHTASDATQDTFVTAAQRLAQLRDPSALRAWLYTIARNTCLTAIERERRLVPLEDFAEAADDDGDPMVFGRGHAGTETAGQAAAEYDVARLLEQLPEPYRRVVVLFYMEDRSCEEVGELLSMPTGTVKALLHRGRKKLAALAGESELES
jgi:RNA polymerase sigma factor (sigma-70 family)